MEINELADELICVLKYNTVDPAFSDAPTNTVPQEKFDWDSAVLTGVDRNACEGGVLVPCPVTPDEATKRRRY